MPSFFALAVHGEPHQEPLTQEMLATLKPAFSAGIKTNTGAGPAGQNLHNCQRCKQHSRLSKSPT